MARIDGHCHSTFSDGAMSVYRVFAVAKRRGLDGAVIADHNTARHQRKAISIAKRMGMITLPAIEITATAGDGRKCHVLAYGIREMPSSRVLGDILDFIRSSGGIAVAAHPYGDHYGCGGIEGFDAAEINGSVMCNANRRAAAEAAKSGMPVTAGSDAHMPWEIGRAFMEFDGDDGESLMKAIRKGRVYAHASCLSLDFIFYKAMRTAGKAFMRM